MSQRGIKFYCFSPPVMLVTLAVEVLLAVYAVARYKMTGLTKLVTLTMIALASFQLSEYFVCTGSAGHIEQWSRAGFVAITLLPPLGLHILHLIADKPGRKLVLIAYAIMAGFIAYFLLFESAFIGQKCTGNYVIFQLSHRASDLYGVYYYGWLFAALGLGFNWAGEMKAIGKKAALKLQAIRGLIVGYLVFLLPTALANTIRPETRRGIPSVMCGFAVLFALILVLYIAPRAADKRTKA
jgi:hypothetical protein